MSVERNENLETTEYLEYNITEQVSDFRELVSELAVVDSSTLPVSLVTFQIACEILHGEASQEEIDIMQNRALLLGYTSHTELCEYIHTKGLQLLGLDTFVLKAEVDLRARLQLGITNGETFKEIQTALIALGDVYIAQFNQMLTGE